MQAALISQDRTRSEAAALFTQAGIRLKYLYRSRLFLRPLLSPRLSGYEPLQGAPEVDAATMLQFKAIWLTAGLMRKNQRRAKRMKESGLKAHLDRWHAGLCEELLQACQGQSRPPVQTVPTFDWRRRSPEDFFTSYVKRPHPVVLKGFFEDPQRLGLWTLEAMARRYGDEEVLLTSTRKDGYPGKFKEVLKDGVYLHNSEYLLKKFPELLGSLQLQRLEPFIHKKVGFAQLFAGRKGTGTAFHSALPWNFFFMLEGKKRWHLVHPQHSFLLYPVATPLGAHASFALCRSLESADTKAYPLFKYCPILEVTLEPGDVLLNPPWWWHAVENITEATVGVASRWHSEGQVGASSFRMTEEDYEISRFHSLNFQLGPKGVPFLHAILKDPSPHIDEHHTVRETQNRFIHTQRLMSMTKAPY